MWGPSSGWGWLEPDPGPRGVGSRDFAGVAELVDAVALGATVLGRAGSSPVPGTGSSPLCALGAGASQPAGS